jgi:hypothetical protein
VEWEGTALNVLIIAFHNIANRISERSMALSIIVWRVTACHRILRSMMAAGRDDERDTVTLICDTLHTRTQISYITLNDYVTLLGHYRAFTTGLTALDTSQGDTASKIQ